MRKHAPVFIYVTGRSTLPGNSNGRGRLLLLGCLATSSVCLWFPPSACQPLSRNIPLPPPHIVWWPHILPRGPIAHFQQQRVVMHALKPIHTTLPRKQ